MIKIMYVCMNEYIWTMSYEKYEVYLPYNRCLALSNLISAHDNKEVGKSFYRCQPSSKRGVIIVARSQGVPAGI